MMNLKDATYADNVLLSHALEAELRERVAASKTRSIDDMQHFLVWLAVERGGPEHHSALAVTLHLMQNRAEEWERQDASR